MTMNGTFLRTPETLESWIRENGIHRQNPEIPQLAWDRNDSLRSHKLSGDYPCHSGSHQTLNGSN